MRVANGSEAVVRNEFPLARSLATTEGLELEGAAGDPSARDQRVWSGGLDSPGRAGEQLVRSHAMRCAPLMLADPVAGLPCLVLMPPPRGIKADACPPARTSNSTAARDAASRPGGKGRAGLREPKHRIHKITRPGERG
jgi:hypothetical protein